MNMCFGKAVVKVLFCRKHGKIVQGAFCRVNPLKLTIKHIILTKYVLIVISSDSIIIRNQNAACLQSAIKRKKSSKSEKGVKNECDKMHILILQ